MTAPTPDERAAAIVTCSYGATHWLKIAGHYDAETSVDAHDVVNAARAAIAETVRAAEAIARAEGRREGLKAAAKMLGQRAGLGVMGRNDEEAVWQEAADVVRTRAEKAERERDEARHALKVYAKAWEGAEREAADALAERADAWDRAIEGDGRPDVARRDTVLAIAAYRVARGSRRAGAFAAARYAKLAITC